MLITNRKKWLNKDKSRRSTQGFFIPVTEKSFIFRFTSYGGNTVGISFFKQLNLSQCITVMLAVDELVRGVWGKLYNFKI